MAAAKLVIVYVQVHQSVFNWAIILKCENNIVKNYRFDRRLDVKKKLFESLFKIFVHNRIRLVDIVRINIDSSKYKVNSKTCCCLS